MKRVKLFSAISILGVLIVIIYLNFKEDTKSKAIFNTDRKYNIGCKLVDSLSHDLSGTDYLLKDQFIYVKDFQNQQIIKTDYKFNTHARYGSRGEGPMENLLIRGFDVSSDHYKTIDAEKNTITKISFDGRLIYTYKSKEALSTGSFLDNDAVIIKTAKDGFGREKIKFSVIDSNSTKEIDLHNIFTVKDNSHWIYDGFFSKTTDNGCIYTTFFSNTFIRFSKNAKILYSKKFIYSVPEIKLFEENGMLFPIENDSPNVYSATSNNKYIFFLTAVGDKSNRPKEIIVDAYLLDSGEYYGSIGFKEDKNEGYPKEIRIMNNDLILFYDSIVKFYKLSFE